MILDSVKVCKKKNPDDFLYIFKETRKALNEKYSQETIEEKDFADSMQIIVRKKELCEVEYIPKKIGFKVEKIQRILGEEEGGFWVLV